MLWCKRGITFLHSQRCVFCSHCFDLIMIMVEWVFRIILNSVVDPSRAPVLCPLRNLFLKMSSTTSPFVLFFFQFFKNNDVFISSSQSTLELISALGMAALSVHEHRDVSQFRMIFFFTTSKRLYSLYSSHL
jgi:hypothetical protein